MDGHRKIVKSAGRVFAVLEYFAEIMRPASAVVTRKRVDVFMMVFPLAVAAGSLRTAANQPVRAVGDLAAAQIFRKAGDRLAG